MPLFYYNKERMTQHTRSNELPLFWVREKTQASAEVDLLLKAGSRVIPVEIKSGSIGKLRSLHSFKELSPGSLAIRIYQGKAAVEDINCHQARAIPC